MRAFLIMSMGVDLFAAVALPEILTGEFGCGVRKFASEEDASAVVEGEVVTVVPEPVVGALAVAHEGGEEGLEVIVLAAIVVEDGVGTDGGGFGIGVEGVESVDFHEFIFDCSNHVLWKDEARHLCPMHL